MLWLTIAAILAFAVVKTIANLRGAGAQESGWTETLSIAPKTIAPKRRRAGTGKTSRDLKAKSIALDPITGYMGFTEEIGWKALFPYKAIVDDISYVFYIRSQVAGLDAGYGLKTVQSQYLAVYGPSNSDLQLGHFLLTDTNPPRWTGDRALHPVAVKQALLQWRKLPELRYIPWN